MPEIYPRHHVRIGLDMTKAGFQNDAIFWVEVNKITPNPYQPRKEFTEAGLKDLAESIRMYGILQPLTVTRREVHNDDGLSVEYELIAGERRLRASKLAGLVQVPVIIRSGPEDDLVKLELAIIENLQREDLNPIDRALAFKQLSDQFNFTHAQIAKKVGKSREYVSNSIRLLQLPEEIQQAIMNGKISEGHARPLGMLRDKPNEQKNVFREVVLKKLTVRETEKIARGIAKDKVRKKVTKLAPEMQKMEKELSESLGTRVHIEPREVGGQLVIDYFSETDIQNLLKIVNSSVTTDKPGVNAALERYEQKLARKQELDNALGKKETDSAQNSLEGNNSTESEAPNDLPTGDSDDQVKGSVDVKEVENESNQNKEDNDPFAYLSQDNKSYDPTSELREDSDSNDKDQNKSDDFGIGRFSI